MKETSTRLSCLSSLKKRKELLIIITAALLLEFLSGTQYYFTHRLLEKELELRAMIAQTLERGKVDFSLWIEQEDTAGATQLNGPLIESYRRQIRHICDVYSIPQPADWWATLLRMPDVTARPESQELSDEEWAVVKQLTEDAIGQLMEFRRQEGAALEKKFSEKLDNIESLLQSIEPYEKERTARIRQRIIDSLQTIPEVETDECWDETAQRRHFRGFLYRMNAEHPILRLASCRCPAGNALCAQPCRRVGHSRGGHYG